MTEDELVVEFALTRLDNPGLELEDIAVLLVRRVGPERMREFASANLAVRCAVRRSPRPSSTCCG